MSRYTFKNLDNQELYILIHSMEKDLIELKQNLREANEEVADRVSPEKIPLEDEEMLKEAFDELDRELLSEAHLNKYREEHDRRTKE